MATFKQYTKKNGDKLWQYQAYLGIDEKTGKRKATTHRGFKSKKEAQIHLNLFLADYERHALDQTPPMTFHLVNLFGGQQWRRRHREQIVDTASKGKSRMN